MSDDPPLSPSQRLALILEGLRKAVAAYAGRNRSFSPIVLILWPYLHRVAARFEALSRRGFISHPARTRPARTGPAETDPPETGPPTPPAEPRARRPRLPGGFGWLARLGPEIRVYGSLLEHLFCDPQMRAILTASPQANRILRPLCRMLRMQPTVELPPSLFLARPPRPVRPPPPPRPALAARVKPPRMRRPRCDPANWWMPKPA